jgi:hypothetical protein
MSGAEQCRYAGGRRGGQLREQEHHAPQVAGTLLGLLAAWSAVGIVSCDGVLGEFGSRANPIVHVTVSELGTSESAAMAVIRDCVKLLALFPSFIVWCGAIATPLSCSALISVEPSTPVA